jgi:hypothetical protein
MDEIQVARDRADFLYETAEEILREGLKSQDYRTVLNAVKAGVSVMSEARQYLELKGQITGELSEQSNMSVERAVIIMPRASDLETMGRGKGPLAFPMLDVRGEESVE